MFTDNPVNDALRRDWEIELRRRNNIGKCLHCGEPILCADISHYGDDYVEIDEGLVHWDCWHEFGRDKRREAK